MSGLSRALGGEASRRHADRLLLIGATAALLASFLHPVVMVERPLFDQVIVLDITQSMNVADYQVGGIPVSRLEHAKHSLRQSLLAMPCGSRIGWGVFTEYRSFLLLAPVEVCANLGELRATLDNIDGRMAWTGNSEVAKGLISGLGIVKQLPDVPSLVFVTDGHESPPVNPRYRPSFTHKPGALSGLIVGVGGLQPLPIPKRDPEGRPMGVWGADEVMQTDPRSKGRGGSVGNESMSDEGQDGPSVALPSGTPGSEHLSALREAYLRLLADESGLGFLRLEGGNELTAALTSPTLARKTSAPADLRVALAAAAFALLLARSAVPLWKQASKRQRSRQSTRVMPPRRPV